MVNPNIPKEATKPGKPVIVKTNGTTPPTAKTKAKAKKKAEPKKATKPKAKAPPEKKAVVVPEAALAKARQWYKEYDGEAASIVRELAETKLERDVVLAITDNLGLNRVHCSGVLRVSRAK